jgi:hypothetical protein
MKRWMLLVAVLVSCKQTPEQQPPPTPPKPARLDAAPPADAAAPEVAPVQVPETAPARRLYIDKLADAETFEGFSKELGGERFAKFVVDVKSDAIYYFDVNVYAVHKDFIFQELFKKPKTKDAVRVFDRNYGKTKTDFLMCYLVHHLAQDQWTFAFWDGDLATSAHVRRAYKRMKESFYLGDKVRFRPDSNYQEDVAKRTPDVPFVLNDELYKLAPYTAFNKGVAIGTLRMVPPDVPEADLVFATDEIVVIKTTLADISPVAGIISEQFSTPLSHLNLRAKGWHIPNVGLKEATTKLAALAGKPVYFEARDADYTIRAATDAELTAETARREARPTIEIPKADLAMVELRTLDEMTAADEATVGPKASNLSVIKAAKLPGVEVPPGFGVPFHYYDAHLKAAGLDQTIAALLGDAELAKDAALRKQKLDSLRKAIAAAPVAPELCAAVATAMAKLPEGGVFVRSSTNAEDLANFSGAGLHETIPNVKGAAAVCEALKAVWASTWTTRAYEARHHAGIDQRTVYGAVLVQTAVAATAAGVVATVHPTDPNDEKNYTINAKSGLGIAVVDGRKVPESLIVSWYNHGIRVLSRSAEDTLLVFDDQGGVHEVPNPNKGKPVLTNKMAIALADTAKRLTKLFKNPKLDIEWVYAGDQLYIVQTRPLVGQ